MNKLLGPIVVIAILGAGIWYVARPQTQTVGETAASAGAAEAKAVPIGEITKAQDGQTVTIEGTIKTECPTGCWAVVVDDTGEIRIDTKAGGFALPLKKEGAGITVTGVVELTEGGAPQISATSAEVR